ncbi:hypothetical protein LX36DRAFT_14541 [Colletotrichum falcatum]|nr:hypothetical protein LX36DRAFT_14541 [Colletotrichum falcatum]
MDHGRLGSGAFPATACGFSHLTSAALGAERAGGSSVTQSSIRISTQALRTYVCSRRPVTLVDMGIGEQMKKKEKGTNEQTSKHTNK